MICQYKKQVRNGYKFQFGKISFNFKVYVNGDYRGGYFRLEDLHRQMFVSFKD